MAVRHSFPLCAPVGLLLLLLGVFSSHLPEVQARPTDFWCKGEERKRMEQRTLDLKKEMADCMGSDTLPSPVQLPGVMFRVAERTNKTLWQKHAEVLRALQVLQDGVHMAISQTTSQCQRSLLQTLERYIKNHLLIVTQSQKKIVATTLDTVAPSESTVQGSTNQTAKVLDQYGRLLKENLERLAKDLEDSNCKV